MTIVITGMLCLAAGWLWPWWGMPLAALLAGGWRGRSGWHALGTGFAGAGLVWLLVAGYFYLHHSGLLAGRLEIMLGIPAPLLLLITALLGGVIGGLAAATGYQARRAWQG